MSEGRSLRKTRSRAKAEGEQDALDAERGKEQEVTGVNTRKTETGGFGRIVRKRQFHSEREDAEAVSEVHESTFEGDQTTPLGKRPCFSQSMILSNEVQRSQSSGQDEDQDNDDDTVDVVTNNDDPLTELVVEASGRAIRREFEDRRRGELERVSDEYQFIAGQPSRSISALRRGVLRDNGARFGQSSSVSTGVMQMEKKPVPATAPLLTTERTHVRVAKRKHDESGKLPRERKLQEKEVISRDGRGRNLGTSRYYYEEEKSGRTMVVMDEVDDVMYAPIDIGGNDFIESSFEDEHLVYTDADDLTGSAGGDDDRSIDSQMRSQQEAQQEGRCLPKHENLMGRVGESADSNDDEAPPELEPQSPVLQKAAQRQNVEKHEGTEYVEGIGEVIRVQTPNGTEQLIQLAPGQSLDDDNALFMNESGNMDTSGRQDLRAIEFNFLDSKNICCGLCGEIVPYDLLLNTHFPQHHPEVLEEGTMAFEDVPYETWLKEKLSEEKRRMESGLCNTYDDNFPSRSTGGRMYRSVSQVRVNPNEMTLNQLTTALRKKMFEKLGRSVPVTLVDKQHARCGICNAVVSLNRKFEVVHLVRHFNAWHPSVHQCSGKWKLRKPQPGMGKPLSIQDFAVIDTSLDRGANLQCIWCGMFMTAEALAMHFSEVHPEEVEVPKCNLCLQELVINARLLEKYADEFDVSMPDEHRIRCGKYGTMHTSEARLHAAIEKRLKLREEGQSANEFDDEEEDVEGDERATSFVNSRMTFGRRSKPKRQFIMPALRQAAPVHSLYVEALSDCHWKCKLCKADILAAVISAGAIRHFRTEHPNQLHDMQYELCKTRLERISDGCMEFVNPQTIECLVCNMTYTLHRPFNMCRAIRHLRSKHPDLMPEFATAFDSGSSSQKRPFMGRQEQPEGYITDPATIAMLKAQYCVDFQKVQALKGADGELVYVLMDEGDDIDPETASQLAASVAAGDFDQPDPKMQRSTSVTSEEVEQQQQQQQQQQSQYKADPVKDEGSSETGNIEGLAGEESERLVLLEE